MKKTPRSLPAFRSTREAGTSRHRTVLGGVQKWPGGTTLVRASLLVTVGEWAYRVIVRTLRQGLSRLVVAASHLGRVVGEVVHASLGQMHPSV